MATSGNMLMSFGFFSPGGVQHGAKPYVVLIEPIQIIRSRVQDYPFDFLKSVG